VQFYKKASASRPPDPLLELRPWTPLQDFRPPVFFYDPPIICEIDALAANTNYGYCWTGTDLLNRLSPSRPTVDRTISSKICSNIHSRFTALVRDHLGGPVPEETFTHSHLKLVGICHHSGFLGRGEVIEARSVLTLQKCLSLQFSPNTL